MENSSKLFAEATRRSTWIDPVPQSREYWPMARAAHMDLQLMRMPRVNLLLMGPDNVIQNVLNALLPNLRASIRYWCPGEPLVLPLGAQPGSLILRDVGALTPEDQIRLLVWLESTAGRTQVVSTTSSPLLAQVEAGAFLDTLYYRLNTMCVNVTI
jgi:hypothetical protein